LEKLLGPKKPRKIIVGPNNAGSQHSVTGKISQGTLNARIVNASRTKKTNNRKRESNRFRASAIVAH